jgi:hypothetical protein
MSRAPSPAAVDVLRRQVATIGILEPFTLGMEECADDTTTAPPEDDEGMWVELYDAGREIGRAALGLE